MSTAVTVSAGIRCLICADDLENLRPFVNPTYHKQLGTAVNQLRIAAARLGVTSTLPPVSSGGDSPATGGRGA